MSATRMPPRVADIAERARALDTRESFLVQAPAGSGKTELLTLRYLALLPTVEEPERVMAITFTRKATAEMRLRVLQALESAIRDDAAASDHEREVRRLARAAMEHAEARGWQLLQQPHRLNIQTIDSLALSIAYQMPLLSRLGGQLAPIDNAASLYALAAERTFAYLGSKDQPELATALARILDLRDTSLPNCEALIAGMLARRDQWLLVLPGTMPSNPRWEELRAQLEKPFQREHEAALEALQRQFTHIPDVIAELLDLARVACTCGTDELLHLNALHSVEELTDATHWQSLCHLLLTKGNTWRKRSVIPAKTHPEYAARLNSLMETLSGNDALLLLLHNIRTLPPPAYSHEEWSIVRNIFVVLRHAMAELRVVFAEQGLIDFAEAGIAAHAALDDPAVLMRLDDRIQHLLVDEFQDTSRPHFALLRLLLQDWQPGDGRTCFFVGDPMQSIYLFRDAESRLFEQVRVNGLDLDGAHHALTSVQLATNFRSTPAIVEPLNDVFARVLADDGHESVRYAASTSSQAAQDGTPAGGSLHPHVQTWQKDIRSPDECNAAEAEALISIVRAHLPAIEEAKRIDARYRVAVLVRSRPHLVAIIARLRRERILFRGVKIDLLRDRPEILDLLSLLRALLHPADRIAWLAVLRAPWCGLPVQALHAICGDLEKPEASYSTPALLRLHADRLDAESRRRALHVLSILEQAQAAYAGGALAGSPASLALWLERTWHALRAPLFLDAESLANTEAFFATLAEMPPDCFGTLDESLNLRLEELYAEPDPAVTERCGVQLMTIHNAKGLEFEVVLVPQLHRPGKRDDPPLFQWLVRRRPGTTEDELLLAPIGRKNDDKPLLYQWVGKKSLRRLRQEEKRLLYVACSRAIHELHLFASLELKQDGEPAMPREGNLLRAGWDGLQGRFREEIRRTAPASNLVTMPGTIPAQPSSGGILPALAAAAAPPVQMLSRLPAAFFPDADPAASPLPQGATNAPGQTTSARQGVRLARVQGIVLHALLERAAAGSSGHHPDWERLADALLRQHSLSAVNTASARTAILQGLHHALAHDEGRWLLGIPEPAQREPARNETAWNEASWSSASEGRLLRQRPDRVFLGGASPGEPGSDHLWIIDYKTAALPDGIERDDFLAASREQYRSQLEAYSRLFRSLVENDESAAGRQHRLAIYHPMLPWLDWWPA